MIINPQHGLILGALDLVGNVGNTQFSLHALSSDDETDWDNPSPVTVVASSFLEDGSMESIDRFENREVTVGVKVEGTSSQSLALAEAALMAECGKANELVWTPPAADAVPSVFEVVTSWLNLTFSDMDELRLERRYILTLRCLPFVRSLDPIRISGPFDGSGTTPIEPTETPVLAVADGVTGWTSQYSAKSGKINGVPQITSFTHATRIDELALGPNVYYIYLTYTGALDLSGQEYLKVEWGLGGAGGLNGPLQCLIYSDGGYPHSTPLFVATQASSSLDGTDTYFRLSYGDGAPLPPAFLAAVTKIELRAYYTPSATNERFGFSEITAWDGWPFESGTAGSQQSLTLDVKGSARTQASLAISHQTTALGDVLAWTGAQLAGYRPDLTQYRVDGGSVTSDTDRLSGSYRPLNSATAETSDIPLANLPQGTYSLYALIRGNAAGGQTISWTAATRLGSTDMAPTSGFTHVELTTGFEIYEIEGIVLPTVAAQMDAAVRLTLSSSGAAFVDEWWLFNTSDGTLTHVKCGSGAPVTGASSSRVWLETPSLARPNPSVWLGTEADQTDARHGSGEEIARFGTHHFPPGSVACFVASTNAGNVAVDLDYHARHHTYPVDLDA